MNSDFILQTIYLGLYNKIFLNKICVWKEGAHKKESDSRKFILLIYERVQLCP